MEAPVSASVEGKATLGGGPSVDGQNLFLYPPPGLNKTATIVQIAGTQGESVTHDLSFLRWADGPLGPGAYEVGANASCDRPCEPNFPDELFIASYGRQTPDSLSLVTVSSGKWTVTSPNVYTSLVSGRAD